MLQALPSVLGIDAAEFHMDPFLGWSGRMDLLRVDLIGIVLLLALTLGIIIKLRQTLPTEVLSNQWAQWRLLLVFLVGGVSFIRLTSESTVPIPEIPLRLLLPFTGLLLGFSIVMSFRYLKHADRWRWQFQALAAAILLLTIIPAVQSRPYNLSPLDMGLHSQPVDYYGRNTDEVQILTHFLEENTSYGDIVFTEVDTGHLESARNLNLVYASISSDKNQYPHPAYEYLSGRRIEIARSVQALSWRLEEFEILRQKIPSENPASAVNFFVLTDALVATSPYKVFAECTGELQSTLRTGQWWLDNWGVSNLAERDIDFSLYKIHPERIEQCG